MTNPMTHDEVLAAIEAGHLRKYDDPTENDRAVTDADDAMDIRQEDPALLYCSR